jgi:hypothetical protein
MIQRDVIADAITQGLHLTAICRKCKCSTYMAYQVARERKLTIAGTPPGLHSRNGAKSGGGQGYRKPMTAIEWTAEDEWRAKARAARWGKELGA